MLEFVEKLTLYPWLLTRTDVLGLRNVGFPDSAILHIVLGSAHFNYLNRMADGIGIRFEYETEIPEASHRSSKPESRGVALPDPTSPDPDPTATAWITFPESKELLTELEGPLNFFLVMASNPQASKLAREWRNYQLKGTTRLDARLRAQLGLYISSLNHCDYSSYWFRKRLEDLGESGSLCERLASGECPPEFSTAERRLFVHGRRLTHEPATTREENIHQLRQTGLDDQGILQLTMLCSYLSFENRVALALGIPIESER